MNPLWQNGHWLSPQAFHPAPTDRGHLHGLALFETFLALDGLPVFLPEHLARLQKSCDLLGWPFPDDDFPEIVRELLIRNHLTEGPARCRLTFTAGSGPLDHLHAGADRCLWMSAQALGKSPDTLSACLAPWPRNEHSPLAGLKSASYAENALALDHARRHGFDQAVFLNTAGKVCEAATANLFVVKNGILHTPPLTAGCLPGITRQKVLDLARDSSISCHEADLDAEDLHEADELFLTSSLHGISPIRRFGDKILETGPVTRQIQQIYQEAVSRDSAIS